MEPLVDKVLENDVSLRQQISHLTILEWVVGIDGTQPGVQFFLHLRFYGLCDHYIGLTLQELVKDRDIIRVDLDPGLLEVVAHKALIRATRIDDHCHVRLVDICYQLKLHLIGAARNWSLPVDEIGRTEKSALLAFKSDGDPAHSDVAFALREVGHELRPLSLDKVLLHSDGPGERFGHLDIDTLVGIVFTFVESERFVVARGAHLQ